MNEARVVVHVGVAWEHGLRTIRRSERAAASLSTLRASIDMEVDGVLRFASSTPLEVLRCATTWAHQCALALALDPPTGERARAALSGDRVRDEGSSDLALRRVDDTFVLTTALGRTVVPIDAFLHALRGWIATLLQDLEDVPPSLALQRALVDLHRADDVLRPRTETPSMRRLRRRSKPPAHAAERWSEDTLATPPVRDDERRVVQPGEAFPSRASTPHDDRPRLTRIAHLDLEHARWQRLATSALRDWAFLSDGRLALVYATHVVLVDPEADEAERLDLSGVDARRPLRYCDGCLVVQDAHGGALYRLDAVAAPWLPVAASIDASTIRAVLRDEDTVRAVWVGDRLLDPRSGAPMLDGVTDAYAGGGGAVGRPAVEDDASSWAVVVRSVGPVHILHRGRTTGEVRVVGGRVVAAGVCRDGAALVIERRHQTVLQWVSHDGAVRWERVLDASPPSDASYVGGGFLTGGFLRGGASVGGTSGGSAEFGDLLAEGFEGRGADARPRWALTVWPAPIGTHRVTISVKQPTGWWCFGLDRRSFLPMLVLHRRTDEAVRIERTDTGVLVATHRGLASYPFSGNQPAPDWEVATPPSLALSGGDVPLTVWGGLVTHMQDDAVVRDARTGEERTRYRDAWPSVVAMVMHASMGLTVLSRGVHGQLDIHHARARHWLGVVEDPSRA